jgi:hypothetical protein
MRQVLLLALMATAAPLLLLPVHAFVSAPTSSFTFRANNLQLLFGSQEEDLFSNHCEDGGFMTRESLQKVPMIADMLVRLDTFVFDLCN